MANEQTETTDNGRSVADIKRDPIVVQDPLAMLDTGRFEAMQRVAIAMAQARLVPKHLQNSPADCLLVVNQAVKRRMDPLDLAQVTFSVGGKLGYEGKVVAAWINASAELDGRLKYQHDGEGDARRVVVSGKLVGEDKPREVEGTVAKWRTKNDAWDDDPDQMLCYRGARQWARRHVPDLLLGIYTPDEMQEMAYGPDHAKDITPRRPTRAAVSKMPAKEEYYDEPLYTLIDEVGEVIGENMTPAEFSDGWCAHYTAAAPGEQFIENNADEVERLKGSKHAAGCYGPIAGLLEASEIIGGDQSEETQQAKAADGAGETPAAPDQPADHAKWKAPHWREWSKRSIADIADYDDEGELRAWFDADVAPVCKANMDASRNEGAAVLNAYNERLAVLQGEAVGAA